MEDVTLPREGVTLQLSPVADDAPKDGHFPKNLPKNLESAQDTALGFIGTTLWDFSSFQL